MAALAENQIYIFIVLGFIIFGLSVYLGLLLVQVKSNKQKQLEKQKAIESEVAEKDKFYKESIILICKATNQGQCDVSEACIRVKKLLEFYPNIESLGELSVIQEMYSELKDFATHDKRLKLTKQEIYDQDKQRNIIEKKHTIELRKSLELLQKTVESTI